MEKNKIELLSDREKEVLKLVCERYTKDQIGEKLGISGRTVGEYKKRIRNKPDGIDLASLSDYLSF